MPGLNNPQFIGQKIEHFSSVIHSAEISRDSQDSAQIENSSESDELRLLPSLNHVEQKRWILVNVYPFRRDWERGLIYDE